MAGGCENGLHGGKNGGRVHGFSCWARASPVRLQTGRELAVRMALKDRTRGSRRACTALPLIAARRCWHDGGLSVTPARLLLWKKKNNGTNAFPCLLDSFRLESAIRFHLWPLDLRTKQWMYQIKSLAAISLGFERIDGWGPFYSFRIIQTRNCNLLSAFFEPFELGIEMHFHLWTRGGEIYALSEADRHFNHQRSTVSPNQMYVLFLWFRGHPNLKLWSVWAYRLTLLKSKKWL